MPRDGPPLSPHAEVALARACDARLVGELTSRASRGLALPCPAGPVDAPLRCNRDDPHLPGAPPAQPIRSRPCRPASGQCAERGIGLAYPVDGRCTEVVRSCPASPMRFRSRSNRCGSKRGECAECRSQGGVRSAGPRAECRVPSAEGECRVGSAERPMTPERLSHSRSGRSDRPVGERLRTRGAADEASERGHAVRHAME